MSNSFLFARAYKLFGLQMLSYLIGVTEIITGLLIATRKFSPMASTLGGLRGDHHVLPHSDVSAHHARCVGARIGLPVSLPDAWSVYRERPALPRRLDLAHWRVVARGEDEGHFEPLKYRVNISTIPPLTIQEPLSKDEITQLAQKVTWFFLHAIKKETNGHS